MRPGPVVGTSGTVGGLVFASGARAFTISGTTITLAIGGTVANNSTFGQAIANSGVALLGSSTWNAANGSSLTVSATISGVGSIVKTGAGLLELTGANGYSGSTSITNGTLSFAAGSLGQGALTVNGGTLRWAAGNTSSTPGNISMGSSGATLDTNGNEVTLTGTLTGGGSLIKAGAGTLTLGAPTTSTSARYSVFGGTLRLGANGALATSKQLVVGGTVASGTSVMDLNGYNLTVSQLTFGGTNAATQAGGTVGILATRSGTLTLGGNVFYWWGDTEELDPGTAVITGNLSLGSSTRNFQVDDSVNTATELRVDAVVSGAGGVIKTAFSYGNMAFNAANTYTGSTMINAGMISVAALANGGVASGIGASSSTATNLTLNTGTLRYTGTGASTDRLFQIGGTQSGLSGAIDASGSGAVAFTNTGTVTSFSNFSATLILTGTNTGDNILAAKYTNNLFAANSLQKDGTGTWILTGANTYTGGTVVNAGRLIFTGTNTGAGAFTVNGGALIVNGDNSGATGDIAVGDGALLGGSGIIGGAVTIQAGGTLSPGNSPGTLTIANRLILADGAVILIEAGDLVEVNGLLTIADDWTLALTSGFQDGGSITLFTYDSLAWSGSAPAFDLSGLGFTPGGLLSLSDTGSAIVLHGISAIPEPAATALLALGGTALLGLGRRKIRR